MKYRIKNLTEHGIIDDIPAYELPDNAFSSGQNIIFEDGRVKKAKGYQQVFGTNPVEPYWAMPFNNQTSLYWIYGGAAKIYVTPMDGVHTNVTRQTAAVDVDYSATLDKSWNGGILGGEIAILNNGIDSPQSWDGSPSNKCVDLTYDAGNTWDDQGVTCSVMRPFKSYLFAIDVTKSGTRFPNLVKWSDSAVAGAVPADWDETDTTIDAGENYLPDDVGFLVDGLPLKDTFVIYGEGAATGVQHIGGRFIFRFFQLFQDGILTKRCVRPVKDRHLVLSQNDLILHDGHSPTSIISKKRQAWLFNNIDQDNFERSFIVPNYREYEMLVCFPSTGSSVADMALVWNYQDNTFSERELPNSNHIAYGIIDPGDSLVIDDQSQVIDTDTSIIDSRTYNPTVFFPLICGTNFYQLDSTEQKDGTNMTVYVERLGLDFGTEQTKFIKRIIPKMSGNGSVTFSLATQTYPGDSVTYTNYTFTPGTDWKIDTRASGKLIGYRVESSSNITWELHSVEFEFELMGLR